MVIATAHPFLFGGNLDISKIVENIGFTPVTRTQVERIVEVYVDNEVDKDRVTQDVLRALETRNNLWTSIKTVVANYGFTGKDTIVLTNKIVQAIFNYGTLAKKH